jgi:hypothetical protein
MQFLEIGKQGKGRNLHRRGAETRLESAERSMERLAFGERELHPGPLEGGPMKHIFGLSPLLAHTLAPDRRKSFISTHIVNDPRG